jgi:hypothetical protein
MDATKPPLSQDPNLKRYILALAAGIAVSALGAAGTWSLYLKPIRTDAVMLSETLIDVTTLFALQLKYQKARGVYANDLDTLLTLSPDRDALKARLTRNVDMTTLAVVGDAKKFKIEANVLDRDRTLIKLKGPVEDVVKRPEPKMTEASSEAGGGSEIGKPLATPPAR